MKAAALLLIVFGSFGISGLAGEGGSSSLEQLLSEAAKEPQVSRSFQPLKRDWVGEIKSSEGHISHLRLEKGSIEKGAVYLARIEPDGNFAPSEKARYIKELPTVAALAAIKTVREMSQLLGKGFRGFETWSGPNGTHGRRSWACFSAAQSGDLVYMLVTAEVSSENGAPDRIEDIKLAHGNLRPAKVESEIEKMIYLSGDQIYSQRRKNLVSNF